MQIKSVVVGALLIAIGATAATLVTSQGAPTESTHGRRAGPVSRVPTRGVTQLSERPDDGRQRATLERQILLLTARIADESVKRQHLEDQVEALTTQLAALAKDSPQAAGAGIAPSQEAAPDQAVVAAEAPDTAPAAATSAMERALVAAGIDATTVADIKRRHDDLAMAEIYLRDQATREEWLDSPRFTEELDAITAQRTSIRDDIGDEAYDRYLFAQGQTNRVRVDDVMLDSVAAQAGLQTGDIVLRYGEARIFGPDELVNETRSGRAGESVRLEIIRNGARLEIQVPRGPLGLRIAASQSEPTS